MENETLDIEDDDVDLPGDDADAFDFLKEETPVVPESKTQVEVKVDSSSIGQTIAEALASGTLAQTEAFRGMAQEWIAAQPKPDAPKKTKDQIAARNQQIQALLMDTDGTTDIEETIRSLIKPMFDSEIEGTLGRLRPQAENIASGQGSALVRDFKRDFKDEAIRGGVNEKSWSRYNAEIDKLIPPEHYTEIASWPKKRQDAHFEAIAERVNGRVYKEALLDKSPRSVTAGGSGGGVTSKIETALRALPRDEQRDAIRIAEAFARAKGFKAGTPEYNKAKAQKVADYLEAE